MDFVYVSFNLKSFVSEIDSNDVFEKEYQKVYKPLTKFLFSHPDFKFNFSLSGLEISFFKRRRKELLAMFKDLVERDQLEILGGGYYNPVLPLIYPADRNGQIDMLSAEIRQTTGKRPRGASLFADCWDNSLVNSFSTCGIEYLLIDSSLVPSNKQKYLPLIVSELGKSIEVYPYYEALTPDENTNAIDFVQNLIKIAQKTEKKDNYFQYAPNRIINISFTHKQIEKLLETKWFDKLASYLDTCQDCKLKIENPINFKKNNSEKIPSYINSGINSGIAKWIHEAYTETETKNNGNLTVFDFMETYPHCHSLYNRILYTGMLVNQYKGDKMRKKAAREKLWEAQNGVGLLCSSDGAFSNSRFRQKAYKALMETEKILRADGPFKESISCFDYNGDGADEYICRMLNYFACISLMGGAIDELEFCKNTGNYADNLKRLKKYDGCDDLYERGIFVDHLFTDDQFEKYIDGTPAGDGVFSRIKYSESKFSRHHNEIQLCANAVLTQTKQKVFLRKKYLINSEGLTVQYIIKNNSDKPLKAKFAVESNFAHTDFNPESITYFGLEVADCEFVRVIDTKKSTKDLYKNNKLKNVDIVRLTDNDSGVSFAFEPNENCGYHFQPLVFSRPEYNSTTVAPVQMTFVSTLYWDVNIEPGMETEKNINFYISQIKKEKKSTK